MEKKTITTWKEFIEYYKIENSLQFFSDLNKVRHPAAQREQTPAAGEGETLKKALEEILETGRGWDWGEDFWAVKIAREALDTERRKPVSSSPAVLDKEAKLEAVIKDLLVNPYGCRFCDSGKLRTPNDPEKDHDEDCPFLVATQVLENKEIFTMEDFNTGIRQAIKDGLIDPKTGEDKDSPAPETGKWVSVNERMPSENGLYRVLRKHSDVEEVGEFFGTRFTNYQGYPVTDWFEPAPAPETAEKFYCKYGQDNLKPGCIKQCSECKHFVNFVNKPTPAPETAEKKIFKCKCGYETSNSLSWCNHADSCSYEAPAPAEDSEEWKEGELVEKLTEEARNYFSISHKADEQCRELAEIIYKYYFAALQASNESLQRENEQLVNRFVALSFKRSEDSKQIEGLKKEAQEWKDIAESNGNANTEACKSLWAANEKVADLEKQLQEANKLIQNLSA